MRFISIRLALLIGGLFFLIACGDQMVSTTSHIATVSTSQRYANRDFLVEVTQAFYQEHPDEYDMLVIWGSEDFGPGTSFYQPVKNDVPGIGYGHVGEEFFDDSAEFGSERLQGIIWMGPNWITNEETGDGPRSNLGILVHETGHRWAATLHFRDPETGEESRALLEDSYHWNFYLNTGYSPIGGNKWEPLGNSQYTAAPVDEIKFSEIELYCMGLISAEEVNPLELLINTMSRNDLVNQNQSKVYSRATQPVAVEADVKKITIEQIIEVEGERGPNVGFNAQNIRQAWIYVHSDPNLSSYSNIMGIEELRNQWGDYFGQATGGRSTMNTSLY